MYPGHGSQGNVATKEEDLGNKKERKKEEPLIPHPPTPPSYSQVP